MGKSKTRINLFFFLRRLKSKKKKESQRKKASLFPPPADLDRNPKTPHEVSPPTDPVFSERECPAEFSLECESLIPGLPPEIALSCIAKLPTSTRMRLRGVSRAWRDQCCGDAINQARAKDGFLLDPCFICKCPVMEVQQFMKRSTFNLSCCESWRTRTTVEYFRKRFNVDKKSAFDVQYLEAYAEEEEDRIVNCLSKLRQQLVSNEKFEPPRNDTEMYKAETKHHREVYGHLHDMRAQIRLAGEDIHQGSFWKSRFRLPQLSSWDHDVMLFFFIM